ncbi:MAG: hypothetical protein Nk1A_9050 [Endomicrobiia bacterium]|nr:MAG: hypothetical protein Nk1A_9050 [Endomicrobiia bacterium]
MIWNYLLTVGDSIYVDYKHQRLGRFKIKRITPTGFELKRNLTITGHITDFEGYESYFVKRENVIYNSELLMYFADEKDVY